MPPMTIATHADRTTRTAPVSVADARPARRDALGLANLLAVLLPGLLFVLGLALAPALAADASRLAWVRPLDLAAAPTELLVIAIGGSVATACGVLDWRYHRAGHRVVPRGEQRAEALALLFGGLPLFVCTAAASVAAAPTPWVLGAIVAALFTAGGIVFDEVRFHRRCSRFETLLHRGLVGGNGIAWLAWMSWCLGRGAGV